MVNGKKKVENALIGGFITKSIVASTCKWVQYGKKDGEWEAKSENCVTWGYMGEAVLLQVHMSEYTTAKKVQENVETCSKDALTCGLDNWNICAQLEEAGEM